MAGSGVCSAPSFRCRCCFRRCICLRPRRGVKVQLRELRRIDAAGTAAAHRARGHQARLPLGGRHAEHVRQDARPRPQLRRKLGRDARVPFREQVQENNGGAGHVSFQRVAVHDLHQRPHAGCARGAEASHVNLGCVVCWRRGRGAPASTAAAARAHAVASSSTPTQRAPRRAAATHTRPGAHEWRERQPGRAGGGGLRPHAPSLQPRSYNTSADVTPANSSAASTTACAAQNARLLAPRVPAKLRGRVAAPAACR